MQGAGRTYGDVSAVRGAGKARERVDFITQSSIDVEPRWAMHRQPCSRLFRPMAMAWSRLLSTPSPAVRGGQPRSINRSCTSSGSIRVGPVERYLMSLGAPWRAGGYRGLQLQLLSILSGPAQVTRLGGPRTQGPRDQRQP